MKFNLQPIFNILKTLIIPLKPKNYDTLNLSKSLLTSINTSVNIPVYGYINFGVLGVAVAAICANSYTSFLFVCLLTLFFITWKFMRYILIFLKFIPFIGKIIDFTDNVIDKFYNFIFSSFNILIFLLVIFLIYKLYCIKNDFNTINCHRDSIITQNIINNNISELNNLVQDLDEIVEITRDENNNIISVSDTENTLSMQQVLIDRGLAQEVNVNQVISLPFDSNLMTDGIPEVITAQEFMLLLSFEQQKRISHYFGNYNHIVNSTNQQLHEINKRIQFLEEQKLHPTLITYQTLQSQNPEFGISTTQNYQYIVQPNEINKILSQITNQRTLIEKEKQQKLEDLKRKTFPIYYINSERLYNVAHDLNNKNNINKLGIFREKYSDAMKNLFETCIKVKFIKLFKEHTPLSKKEILKHLKFLSNKYDTVFKKVFPSYFNYIFDAFYRYESRLSFFNVACAMNALNDNGVKRFKVFSQLKNIISMFYNGYSILDVIYK